MTPGGDIDLGNIAPGNGLLADGTKALLELPSRRSLLGNEIVDHSDVVGASPVGAAPTTSSFST